MYTFEKKEETYLTKAIYAYGINKNIYNPFYLLDENLIFYCVGTNGVVHSLLERNQRFLLSEESSYGIICLGISNDKKLLALGEKSINKPFISIFSNDYKLVKRLTLEISDNESDIMNICFSSKNKYIYCITNGSTKSLLLCYDWIQEKLIFSKIFPPSLFRKNCEICLNAQNSAYIALLSINNLNLANEDTNKSQFIKDKGVEDLSSNNIIGIGRYDGSDLTSSSNVNKNDSTKNEDKNEINSVNRLAGSINFSPVYGVSGREVLLYHNVERNLVEIKIRNKKLEKIDNYYTNCCWLNDGTLLLVNRNNYLIFYDVKKEKLKIFNKHISNDDIVNVTYLTKGFLLFDYRFIYVYEKSNDLSTHLSYSLKYYINFNYGLLFSSYFVLSSCEKFLYFLGQDGKLKRFDITRSKIVPEYSKNVNYESLRDGTSTKDSLQSGNNKDQRIKRTDDYKQPLDIKQFEPLNESLTNQNRKAGEGGKSTDYVSSSSEGKKHRHKQEKEKEKEEVDERDHQDNQDDQEQQYDADHLYNQHGQKNNAYNLMGNNSTDDITKDDDKNIETVLENISSAKINDFDVCLLQPLIIICYDDNVIKIINYKKKEEVMSNSFNNEPLHLSIHCSGHLLLVAFTDKLRVFHILYNKLKVKKEFFLKNCSCCKFSNGGNFMAVSKISTLYIYKTYTYDLLYVLKSHVNYITDIIWSFNDFSIFSIGKDGYMFEYSLYNNGNKNIEIMQKEKKFLSLDLEFLNDKDKKKEINEKNNLDQMKYDNENKSFNNNLRSNEIKNIYVSCDDYTIKQFCGTKMECVIESEHVINKILLYKNKFLIATFHNGFFCRIRFYKLPLCGIYLEIPCHISNCVNLKLDVSRELLFSCSKDGSIYIFSIEKVDNYFLETNNMTTTNYVVACADGESGIYRHKSDDYGRSDDLEEMHDRNNNRAVMYNSNNDSSNSRCYCKNDTAKVYSDVLKTRNDLGVNVNLEERKSTHNSEFTMREKKLSLSDLNNDSNTNKSNNNNNNNILGSNNNNSNNNILGSNNNTLSEKRKMRTSFLLYDLNSKSNYMLNEDEKENEDILIDFYYVQKKNKEFLELQKKITNVKDQMELEMKNKESIYKNEIKKLKKEKNTEINNLMKINKNIIKEKEKIENACRESLYELEEKHTYFVNQLNSQFYLTNKICEEKYLKIEEEFNLYKKNSINEILDLKNEHDMKINEMRKDTNEQIQKKDDYIKNFELKYENLQKEKDEYIKRIEEDVDEEIVIITKKYEEELDKLKKDKYDLLGKFKFYEYIENELKENIQVEKEKFIKNNITAKRLQENIDNLKVDINSLKDNILGKEKEIESKNNEIANLNKKNEELEKLKIVLTQKIKDLESNLSPKDSEIKIMREKIDEMAECFENNHKKTVNLQIEINEYKMKIKSLQGDLLSYNKTIGNYEKILKNLQEHIKECYLHLHDKKIFNSSFLNLYNKFHKVNDVKNYDTKNVFSEYIRQKEYLENMIQVLKDKLDKETEAFRTEKIKMMNENSLLLKEINDLKMDLNFLKSECHDVKLKNRKMEFLRKFNKKKETGKSTTNAVAKGET
ncbi:WD repeat-containing protein 65 [Plasmodium brasilianum]|uniref:WD repeat-containing protein 65 n=2 Tax=Plasmodium (Plasmodium) TaxID=418103 RepID=A0A1A8WFB9_PLAMA|nr:WD repeat-containing protein 65 [Plasmodium brasilianum]SBS89885.1 hypothetical protein PMALA_027750 [Plasmodium malariae]